MDLTEIQHADKKVLTTAQIAEAYEVDSKSLIRNFQRNKEHYQEGTHYFALTGEALKQFKGGRQNDATLKFVSLLYLWTEEGAFLLAKSLSSDKAGGIPPACCAVLQTDNRITASPARCIAV